MKTSPVPLAAAIALSAAAVALSVFLKRSPPGLTLVFSLVIATTGVYAVRR